MRRDGESPAFPNRFHDIHGNNYGDDGMSMREYFAAHAPENPQRWFKPVVAERPERPAGPGNDVWGFNKEQKREASQWLEDATWDLGQWGEAFQVAWEVYWDSLNEWEAMYAKETVLQWPWAWADQVLLRREI